MLIQMGSLIEIRPVNSRTTLREFVAFHQVARVYHDALYGEWAATLIDGSSVMLLNAPEEAQGNEGQQER